MFCAISGEAPKEPVVSIKSGHVYEKRLIERYIDENGKDPITAEELRIDDLVPLKTSPNTAFPRSPMHSSVPSLMMALQNEYDAMVFETLALKKQYDAVRQDLAHALYTNDASMRVIARLIKERDEARDALANVHTSLGLPAAETADVDMPTAPSAALPDAIVASIDEKASSLSGERRARIKRGAPEGYTTADAAGDLHEQSALSSLHGASAPGVTALDISANGALLLTGGKDKTLLVLDRASEKVLSKLTGHTKAVTCAAFSGRANPCVGAAALDVPMPSYAVSGSMDKNVRVWRAKDQGGYVSAHILKGYTAEVTGVDIHPTDQLVGSASRDGSWAIHALDSGERLLHITAPSADEESADGLGGYTYESFAFHPDGQLAATGTADGAVRVWDVKHGKQSAVFRGNPGAVHALHFSPNGYLLAAASRASGDVKVWDLRKLDVARTVQVYTEDGADSISQLRYDPTAQLLAVAGRDLRVFAGKSLAHACTLDQNSAPFTSVQWNPLDGSLAASSLDRTVRFFGTHDL